MNRFRGWIAAIGILSTLSGAASCGGPGTIPPEGCSLIGCNDGAYYQGTFPLGGVDPATLEVRACMNATCDTQALRPVAGDPRIFTCRGAVLTECQLQVEGTSAFIVLQALVPEGMDPSTYLQEGDQYQITFGVPGQKPLATIAARAGYQINEPNGAQCGPTCKQIVLKTAP